MTDAMVDAMFPALFKVLTEKSVQSILTTEQKRAILEAVDAHVEKVDDTHFRIGMLFVVLDVDSSDPDNPKMGINFDMSALLKLVEN